MPGRGAVATAGQRRAGPRDSDVTPGRWCGGEIPVVTGGKETSKQWQSPFSDTV